MAVFIKAGCGLNLGLLHTVDAVAGDMTKDGIKRLTRHLMAFHQVKKRIVILQVREALVPAVLLNTLQLFTLDLGHDLGSSVRERLSRR